MTTAYTHVLEQHPATTFRSFALRCARATSALSFMHDASLDAPIPDDPPVIAIGLARDTLFEARSRLDTLQAMSQEDRRVAWAKELLIVEESGKRVTKEYAEKRGIFTAMRANVEAWTFPPQADAPALLGPLREFMLKQLDWAIEEYVPRTTEDPGPPTPGDWYARELRSAQQALAHAEEHFQKQTRYAQGAREWIALLKLSLPAPTLDDDVERTETPVGYPKPVESRAFSPEVEKLPGVAYADSICQIPSARDRAKSAGNADELVLPSPPMAPGPVADARRALKEALEYRHLACRRWYAASAIEMEARTAMADSDQVLRAALEAIQEPRR